MALLSTTARYGAVAQAFHWLTVLFVGAAYILSEGGPESRVYAPERAGTLSWHETCGTIVLALLVLRLLWRIVDGSPEEAEGPAWMRIASRAVQGFL